MLLRELDDHWYSYWVEVSGNYKDWEMVIDKRQEKCQGWQFLTFDRSRPVVFIRITATPESVEQVNYYFLIKKLRLPVRIEFYLVIFITGFWFGSL